MFVWRRRHNDGRYCCCKPAEKKINSSMRNIEPERKSVCTCVAFNIERRMCRHWHSSLPLTLASVCVRAIVCVSERVHWCMSIKQTSWELGELSRKHGDLRRIEYHAMLLSESNGSEWHLSEFITFNSRILTFLW